MVAFRGDTAIRRRGNGSRTEVAEEQPAPNAVEEDISGRSSARAPSSSRCRCSGTSCAASRSTDVCDGLAAIPPHRLLLSALGSLVAYAAIAGYDRIALPHIGKQVPLLFVSLCSFTTYALSHNIGGSVLSGAVIRYRAYAHQGLSGSEIGILVAICWFTFVLRHGAGRRACCWCSRPSSPTASSACCRARFRRRPASRPAAVALYIFGSWLHLKPAEDRGHAAVLSAPADRVARSSPSARWSCWRPPRSSISPCPEAGNPGYFVVLGIFVVAVLHRLDLACAGRPRRVRICVAGRPVRHGHGRRAGGARRCSACAT